jgi:hypothetical protein
LAIQGPRFISSSTLKIFFSASFLGKGRSSREDAKSFPHARFPKFIIPDHLPGGNGIAAKDRAIPKTKIAKYFTMFILPVMPFLFHGLIAGLQRLLLETSAKVSIAFLFNQNVA